jgi:hypothetical protein
MGKCLPSRLWTSCFSFQFLITCWICLSPFLILSSVCLIWINFIRLLFDSFSLICFVSKSWSNENPVYFRHIRLWTRIHLRSRPLPTTVNSTAMTIPRNCIFLSLLFPLYILPQICQFWPSGPLDWQAFQLAKTCLLSPTTDTQLGLHFGNLWRSYP